MGSIDGFSFSTVQHDLQMHILEILKDDQWEFLAFKSSASQEISTSGYQIVDSGWATGTWNCSTILMSLSSFAKQLNAIWKFNADMIRR